MQSKPNAWWPGRGFRHAEVVLLWPATLLLGLGFYLVLGGIWLWCGLHEARTRRRARRKPKRVPG